MGGRKRTRLDRIVEEKNEAAIKSGKLGQTACEQELAEGVCSMAEESGGEGGEAVLPIEGCVNLETGAELAAQGGAGGEQRRNEPILGAQDVEAGLAWLESCLEAEVARSNDEVVRREAAEADAATAKTTVAQLETEVTRLRGLLVTSNQAVNIAKGTVDVRAEEGPDNVDKMAGGTDKGAEGMGEEIAKLHKEVKDADKMVAEAKATAEAAEKKAEEANTRAAAFMRAFAEQTGRVSRAQAAAALAQAGADALARELAQTKNADRGLEMIGAGRLRQLLLEKSQALDEANARAERAEREKAKAEMDSALAKAADLADARAAGTDRARADEVARKVGVASAQGNADGLTEKLEQRETCAEAAESVVALANARLAGMQAEVAGLKRLLVEKDRAAKEAKARAEKAERRRAEEAIARTSWANARAEEAGDTLTEDLTRRVRAHSTTATGQTGNVQARKVAQPGECCRNGDAEAAIAQAKVAAMQKELARVTSLLVHKNEALRKAESAAALAQARASGLAMEIAKIAACSARSGLVTGQLARGHLVDQTFAVASPSPVVARATACPARRYGVAGVRPVIGAAQH